MASKSTTTNRKGPRGGRPAPGGGRVTPKGAPQHRVKSPTARKDHGSTGEGATDWAAEVERNHAPAHPERGPSPTWWPVLMFGLIGVGIVLIVLNYTGLLPGTPNNWMLAPAVLCIGAGLFAAMSYR